PPLAGGGHEHRRQVEDRARRQVGRDVRHLQRQRLPLPVARAHRRPRRRGGDEEGQGSFVYKLDKGQRPVIEGQYGLNDEDNGSDWTSMKQPRMTPDLKSIGGDSEGVPPSSF